ncbi:MAG TPA: hypothetical protein VGQ04_07790 [Chitinophagaceae bacterium]|nr:hypothetical protein [Chitinophagaceae bacterium]
MKQNLTRLSLSALLVAIGLASFAQISNNATTIFLQDPSASGCPSPAAGNYTLSITYYDLNNNGNPITANYPAIVSYNGTTLVITASTANFPTASTAGYDLSQTTGSLSVGTSGTYFFDLGQVNCSALPVTLTSWGATVSVVNGYKQIHFTWSTASESNSCYYSIEWAPISNQVWQGGICRVPAAGNSSWNINYSFDWLYPQAVDYLFRLKMVDIDGSARYSTVIRRTMSCLNGGSGCFRTAPNCSVTINGPNQVCFSNSAGYTLSSLNDRGIVWSTSSSLASVQDGYSCTDNGAILNAGSSFGSVTLSAKINGCSNTIAKTVQIGVNADFTYTVYPDGYLIASGPSGSGYTNYQWTLNLGSKGTYYFSGPSVSFQMPSCSGGAFNLTISTPCGQASAGHTIWNSNCGGYYRVVSVQGSNKVRIQPSVDSKNSAANVPSITQVLVYDNFMNVKFIKKYQGKTKLVDLDLSGLQTGIYQVQLITETGKETHSVQVVN